MFRPIRRKAREISTEAAKQLLKQERRGVLAVNGDDGYPYALPINYLYDEEENKIYFHGALAGHKYDSIKACDKVCFTVYGNEHIEDVEWAPYMQSTILYGRCHMITDQEQAVKLVKKLAMKYFPDEQTADVEIAQSAKGMQMYEIEIEYLTGKQIQER